MLVIVAQMVKRVPGMRETRVRSLGWEDPLEKEMATHSSIHAWRIPWTEEPGRLQSMGSQSQTRLSDFTFTLYIRMIFGVLWVTENILLYFIHLLFEIDENQLSAEFMWEPSHVNHGVIRCHCAPVKSHTLDSMPFSRASLLLSTLSTFSSTLPQSLKCV